MSLWRQLTRGLRALTHRQSTDADVAEELRHYMDLSAAAHEKRGLAPDAARRAAQLEMGNMTVAREQVRAYGWENVVETLVADGRYALRRLRANPGFTVVSVVTLALGIGAATTIFSVVNPILFESLPYPHASRLVTLADRSDDGSVLAPTFGTFAELVARSRSFSSLAIADRWQPSLTGTSEPERLVGERVSAGYFRTLGVAPSAGRDFSSAEDQPSGPRVVIVSDRLVQRRFGGDRSIVGRAVRLNDDEYLVIGVMPPRFTDVLSPAADIWGALQAPSQSAFNSREWGHHYRIVGHLRDDVSRAMANVDLKTIAATPIPQFSRPPWAGLRNGILVQSLQDEVTRDARPALFAIIGAVLLLLTIACVNVTNLLLARGAQRRAEFAMRVALGAGRRRLLRQLLTESLVLAIVGGAGGLGIAAAGVRMLIALSPPGLPRADAIGVDGSVFLFALAASTAIGLLVGLAPALGAARGGLSEGLQGGSRRSTGGRAGLRRGLVVAEVALALVLLVSAGLLMRSLEHLFAVAPGFDASNLLTMQVIDPGAANRSDVTLRQFYERGLEAARRIPGVTAAAFTSQLPLSDDLDSYGYEVASSPSVKAGEDGAAFRYVVTPGYFQAMRIPLREGRLLEATDVTSGPEAVVISESFARQRFGARSPIGERVRFGPETGSDRPWDIIVGVVGDVKQQSLASQTSDAFYVAMGRWSWVDNVQSLVVRTSGDPAALAPSIKRAVWSVDANQPIQRIMSMDALIALSASQRRFALVIIESFALAALLLAAVGIYGVLSGSVSERMREIGVRSALGASRGNILGLIVRQGLTLSLLGIVIGAGAAVAATRALDSLMFDVSRLDAVTYGGVVTVLVGVALVACWLPAWRAARVDPVITLRSE
jgi:putative ABC transport system permease protein